MAALAPAGVLESTTASPSLDAPTSATARVLPVASTSSLPLSQPKSASSLSTSAAGASGCRLLWRGRLLRADKGNRPLFGLAIIAHLFSVPSISLSATAKQAAATVSPFDDPFAATSSSGAAGGGADMCLGLEMMRGGDLKILGEVHVSHAGSAGAEPSSAEQGASARKAKGKGKEQEQRVEVETPTDVRVYVDPRCPETRDWLEDQFCRAGCEGRGLRVDMGGEEVIIFGSAPTTPALSPSTSSIDLPPRPPITLLLGRVVKRAVRAPRPDDPMPRETVFAKKLRRTSSTPALTFPYAPPKLSRSGSSLGAISEAATTSTASAHIQAQRKLKRGSSSRMIQNLMGDEAARKSVGPSSSRQSSLPPPPAPEPPAKKARTLSRSSSSRSLLSATSTTRPSLPATISAPAALPPSKGSTLGKARSSLKRSRSARILDSPESSDTEDVEARRGASRAPGSPTPSVATTFGGWDEDLPGMGEEEEGDELSELARGLGQPLGISGRAKMKRSTSAPVGLFEKQLGAGPLRDGLAGIKPEASAGPARGGRERSESVAPVLLARSARGESVDPRTMREQSVGMPGRGREESAAPDSIEGRNKGTVRKLVLATLLAHSIPREHPQFRDVFSMCSKGVQFALREHWKTRLVDKERAQQLAEVHAGMYVLSVAPITVSTATSAPMDLDSQPLPQVPEPAEARMPTPAATPVPHFPVAPATAIKIEIKTEEEAAPNDSSAVQATQVGEALPPQLGSVKTMDETHLPSPRSLEVAGEDSAEEGVTAEVAGTGPVKLMPECRAMETT